MEIKTYSQNQEPEWLHNIVHTGTIDHISNPYPKMGETVVITLEVPLKAQPEQVVLRSIPNGEQQLSPMKATEKGALCSCGRGSC